jgi:hypothetical protein
LVKGILTGTGPDQPVEIYNNAETFGLRLLAILIEDTLYGFELILLNMFLYLEVCSGKTMTKRF